MMYRIAPLPGTFMLMAMFGFIISAVYTFSGKLELSLGFSFCLVFGIMFAAAVLSITPWFPQDLEDLPKDKKK